MVRESRCAHRGSEQVADGGRRGADQRIEGESAGTGVGGARRVTSGGKQWSLEKKKRCSVLLYLTQKLTVFEGAFRLFNYLTLRSILAALKVLVLSFLVGWWVVRGVP